MEQLTVYAPAKVNLALEVCGRRPDGYHELDMLMQAVTLYETVTLQKQPDGIALCCRAAEGGLRADIPTDSHNIAWRAAQLFFAHTGLAGGVALTVTKAVPSQAGMAGGSADAAGVLWGLDRLYAAGLSACELQALGAQLGSDVPFCLQGGTARVRGRGERVTPTAPLPPCALVAVMPPTGSATPAGFARYDAIGSPLHPDIDAAAAALRAGDLAALCAQAGNALQAACATDETRDILRRLQAAGALTALLTGTGAVTYGIFADLASANTTAAALKKHYAPVFVLRPEARGPFAAQGTADIV